VRLPALLSRGEHYAICATTSKGQPPLHGGHAWYVRPALEVRRGHPALAGLCAIGLIALSGCGGGDRQDKDEPSGKYRVDVTEASFPAEQKLAKQSDIVIAVKNTGNETVPNITVTLNGLDYRLKDPQVADPSRPQFVINGVPKNIGSFAESKEAAPEGGETAYVNTWALGPLSPGKERTFRWTVTAVKAGPYKLTYEVAAGLNGKAKAVNASDQTPRGLFAGTVTEKPPKTRVSDDGKTVIEGTR
jgi:hypothetical protein